VHWNARGREGIAEEVERPADLLLTTRACRKRSTNRQPESKQLCAVTEAVVEVIEAEGLQCTPAALFAAGMSSLERPGTLESPLVASAICSFLSFVLPRCASSVLHLRMNESLMMFNSILENSEQNHSLQKSAILCLGGLLKAADPDEWTNAALSFHHLLVLGIDGKPKVRRRASSSLAEVLLALRGTESGDSASEVVFKVCCSILPAPATAIAAASELRKKKFEVAKAEAERATERALHLIGLLKTVLPTLASSWSSRICELIVGFYPLGQPLLTKHATDTLSAFLRSTDSSLSEEVLVLLLERILKCQEAWDVQDADNVLAAVFLVAEALKQLLARSSKQEYPQVATAYQVLVPLMASEKEGVVLGVAEGLRQIIQHTVTESMVAKQVSNGGKSLPKKSTLRAITVSMESLLGLRYRTVWIHAFPLLGFFLEKMGNACTVVAPSIIMQLADIYAVPEEREILECASQLEDALGKAVRAGGPENINALLPLNLIGALDAVSGKRGADVAAAIEAGGGRAWLLEVYKKHIQCASLAFFAKEWLPLANALEKRSAVAKSAGRALEAKVAIGLETQIWAVLPAFCHWTSDTSTSFPGIAKELGSRMQSRPDLRGIICAALRQLVNDNIQVSKTGNSTKPAMEDEGEEVAQILVHTFESGFDEVPEFYTSDLAQRNLDAISSYSKNFLPVLFNLYIALPPDKRGDIHATIRSFSRVTDKKLLGTFFRTVMKKLVLAAAGDTDGNEPASTEGGATVAERRCTFMELALALAGDLDEGTVPVLYKACKPALMEPEVKVQKKGYKLLAYLCTEYPNFCKENIIDILQMMEAALPLCNPASKLNRLHCIEGLLVAIVDLAGDTLAPAEKAQAMTVLVGEICLCTKEVNAKTRSLAYELLVQLADGFPQENGGVCGFVNIVVGGLVGGTPHMQSAAVMALARLLFEFPDELEETAPEILATVLTLLRGRSREIVKSVLGFVKVAIGKLGIEELRANLQSILESLLLWGNDSKNRFKLKVKVILERISRKLGFEELEAAMPHEHRKLLTNIRRTNARKERRKHEDGDYLSEGDVDVRSFATRTSARSKAQSGWAHTDFFGDGDSDDDPIHVSNRRQTRSVGARTNKAPGSLPGAASRKRARQGIGADFGEEEGDPMDLLDHGMARHVLKSGAKRAALEQAGNEEGDREFKVAPDGRLVIKREWEHEVRFAEDDEENNDARSAGGRSSRSKYARTEGGRSRMTSKTGVSSGGRSARSQKSAGGKSVVHEADRYRSKKSKGDVKGAKKFEPYAYWPMDRRMMNRRPSKRREAKQGLQRVLHQGD